MNGLGRGAFVGNSTQYKELMLDVNPEGDTLQFNFSVSNVGDDQFPSAIIIDVIEIQEDSFLTIQSASVFDGVSGPSGGGPLLGLSMSPHSFLGGSTFLRADLIVKGNSSASISEAKIEIKSAGALLATANASTIPNGTFGTNELLSINSIFNFVPPNASGSLILEAVIRSSDGTEARAPLGSFTAFNLYRGLNRYKERNVRDGGDGWALPSTLSAATSLTSSNPGILFGDFSNMNGGHFIPHDDHQKGTDIDFWFPSIGNVDAALNTALGILGSGAKKVYVCSSEEFQIKRKVLIESGAPAAAQLIPATGHCGHFHVTY